MSETNTCKPFSLNSHAASCFEDIGSFRAMCCLAVAIHVSCPCRLFMPSRALHTLDFAAFHGQQPKCTSICWYQTIPFRWALSFQSSGINCYPAPDLMLRKPIFLYVLLSRGICFLTDAGGSFVTLQQHLADRPAALRHAEGPRHPHQAPPPSSSSNVV